MAEYIDREELFKDIEDSVRFSTRNGMSAELRGAHKIVDCIRSASACDVVEVVHGHWERSTGSYSRIKCSICGWCKPYIEDFYEAELMSDIAYCPNCGAKMDDEGRCDNG